MNSGQSNYHSPSGHLPSFAEWLRLHKRDFANSLDKEPPYLLQESDSSEAHFKLMIEPPDEFSDSLFTLKQDNSEYENFWNSLDSTQFKTLKNEGTKCVNHPILAEQK